MRFTSRRSSGAVGASKASRSRRQPPTMKRKEPAPAQVTGTTGRRTDWTPVLVVILLAVTAVGVAMLLRGMSVL
jgi:hypothetical protein